MLRRIFLLDFSMNPVEVLQKFSLFRSPNRDLALFAPDYSFVSIFSF